MRPPERARPDMSDSNPTEWRRRGRAGVVDERSRVLDLRLRLEQVLLGVFRTGRAMADGQELPVETRTRLESLRREASWLENAIYGADRDPPAPSPADTDAGDQPPPVPATREGRLRAAAASATSSRSTCGTMISRR